MIRLCLKLLLVLIIHSSFAVDTQAQSIAEIAENVGKSVAMIITYDVTGSPIAQGSGVFITKTGIILTNAHVVNDAYSAEVISSFGTFDKVRILAQDSKRDLALISIPTDNSFPVSVAGNTNFKPGDRVIAIGNPLGLEKTISDGLISGIRHRDDGVELIQTTVPISHGSSGGVLLDSSGELIGITTSSFEGGQNINFAISLNTINDFIGGYQNDGLRFVVDQELRPAKESVWYRIILKWIGYIVFGIIALVFGGWSGWALPLIFLAFYLLYLIFKGMHWLITYPFRNEFLTPKRIAGLAMVFVFAIAIALTGVFIKPAKTDEKLNLPRSVSLPESEPLEVKEVDRVRRAGDSIGLPLENGDELVPAIFPAGEGRLTVVNETSLDAVVKLVEEGKGTTLLRYWFIESKKTVVLDDLGPCDCSLYFGLGKEWDHNTRKFRLNRSYGKYKEPLTFTETKTPDGLRSQNYTVHFAGAAGSIAQTHIVDETTFNELF